MMPPLCLRVEDWPPIDQQIWREARMPMRFGRRARIAGGWSEARCKIVCQGYGQWLSCLIRRGELDPTEPPESRATRERIETFVTELQARVAPWSVAMMVQATQRMLTVMAPDHDWDWLDTVVANLKRLARPARDKRPHMVDPVQLYGLGIDLMTDARRRATDGDYHAATMGRDGLIIATLIACPVRIANLTMIEIGRHLIAAEGAYMLKFSEEETKTGRAIEAELPPQLTPWIDFYLRVHRPRLLERGDDRSTRRLWISRWGTPMIEHAVRDQIRKRTGDAFGRHVWPHLFRAIAATGMVDHAPEQAGLLPDLLGHGDERTSKRHYVLSSGTLAHRAVQSVILDLRRAAAGYLKSGGRT